MMAIDEPALTAVPVVKPTILIDIDEVLFPFADAYSRWLVRTHGLDFEPSRMRTYDIARAVGPHHSNLAVQFVNDPMVVSEERALAAAVQSTSMLSRDFRLLACTRRLEILEGAATREWMNLNFTTIEQVVFTRSLPSAPETAKAAVAQRIRAVALIDDNLSNLAGLPASCRPYLIRRPPGLPSDTGAVNWHEVLVGLGADFI
jgi:hypothetical protein